MSNKTSIQKSPYLQLCIDEVQETIVAHQKRRKRYQLGGNIAAATILLGITIIGIGTAATEAFFFLAIGLSNITQFSGIWGQKRDRKKFQAQVDKYIYEFALSRTLPDLKHTSVASKKHQKHFSETDEEAYKIFANRIWLLDMPYMLTGKFAHHPIVVWKMQVALHPRDYSGHRRNNDLFNGLLVRIQFNFKTPDRVVIAPQASHHNINGAGTHLLGLHQKGFEPHKCSDMNFSRYFKVYSDNLARFPSVISPLLQRQLAHFVTHHKVQVHAYFVDEFVYIALRTNQPVIRIELDKKDKDLFEVDRLAKAYLKDLEILQDLLKRLELGRLLSD